MSNNIRDKKRDIFYEERQKYQLLSIKIVKIFYYEIKIELNSALGVSAYGRTYDKKWHIDF